MPVYQQEKFQIAYKMKKFILGIEKILVNFPKKDYITRSGIYNKSLEILETLYIANVTNNRICKTMYQESLIAKLNIVDFYLEVAYFKKYISEEQCKKLSDELVIINKMVYKWIKYEK